MSRDLSPVIVGLVLSATVGGCSGPTYPKERLAESLQQVLAEDQLKSVVRFFEHTLAVQLEYPDALAQQGNDIVVGPAFHEAARKVLSALHRVLLSTDADVRFYVLLLSDPQTPGAYLTMVRYLDDVRRADVNILNTEEVLERTVFDLNYVGDKTLTIEQYVPRGIKMEEFLSWQLARRLQHQLMETLQLSGRAEVGRCGGEFRNGEFAFTLNVTPTSEGSLDEATVTQIFQTSTQEIANVLSSYQFNSFEAVRLILPAINRNLVLPKTHLQAFQ
jgi:hypothetical protein